MSGKSYKVVKSKDGKNVLHLTDNGSSIYLGSKYNVGRDIIFFLNSLGDAAKDEVFIVFGLACGEHLFELKGRIGEDARVIVFEPDKKIIDIFSGIEFSQSVFNDGRFYIYHFDQDDGIEKKLGNIISDYDLSSIAFSYYTGYEYVYREQFLCFIGQLKDYITNLHVGKNTNIVFSKIWFDAFLRNIKIMNKSAPIDQLKGKYNNKPAIIVSSGPSLKKNIHLLKEVQDKFVVITGGRSLKALIDQGVLPHFVCVIDPVEKTYKLLEESLDCEAPLLFYEGTNPDVVEKYKGPKVYFTANHFTGDFIQRSEIGLNYGGSVAHTCFGLAVYMGCDRIIFIGQDFAYTDDKIHAENTVLKDEKNEYKKDTGYFYVDDINGNKVKTDMTFNLFRKTMENLIRLSPGKTYVNATEGGANIKGTVVMTLAEAIEEYSEVETVKRLDHDICLNDSHIQLEEKIKEILDHLRELMDDCQNGKKLSRKLVNAYRKGDNQKIIKINKKLDQLDNKFMEVFNEAGFLNFILYPLTQMIMGYRDYKINKDDTEEVAAKKILAKTKKLYEEMDKTLKDAIIIMENNLKLI